MGVRSVGPAHAWVVPDSRVGASPALPALMPDDRLVACDEQQ